MGRLRLEAKGFSTKDLHTGKDGEFLRLQRLWYSDDVPDRVLPFAGAHRLAIWDVDGLILII